MGEIKINTYDVRKAAYELEKIQREISQRKLTVSFSESRGETVDAIQEVANALLAYGGKTAAMIGDLGTILKETAERFERADSGIDYGRN